MVKSRFVCFVFVVGLGTLVAQDQRGADKSHQVILKYLGTAGWEITDGITSILIDPYLSRINGPAPPGGGSGHSMAGDTRRAYGWNDVASPTLQQSIRTFSEQIMFSSLTLITTTSWMFRTSPSKLAL